MTSFASFQKEFCKELSSPHFGESAYDQQSLTESFVSPGAKELTARNLAPLLKCHRFLKSVHASIRKHDLLARELGTINREAVKIRQHITKLRNTQKTLVTIQRTFRQLYFRLDPQRWNVPHEFEEVLMKLDVCIDKLLEREQHLVWCLHPKTRKPQYTVSRWAALWHPYNYSLETLRAKAPDQWLIETVNSKLVSLLARKTSVSDMTHYRIISALLKAGGVLIIDPGTIKQHLIVRQKLAFKPCKNSRRS